MTKQRTTRGKLLLALLAGRFEPIEIVVSVSAVAHGLWLIFPYWSKLASGSMVAGAPRWSELLIAGLLALSGASHLTGLATGSYRVRRYSEFFQFIMWMFFTSLAAFAVGLTGVIWFPYATLTLVSALLYLSISVGVLNGPK